MPRTTIPAQAVSGPYTYDGIALVETPADVVNLNQSPLVDGLMLIAHNTAGAGGTVTVTSANDPFGRSKDIAAYAVAAGAVAILGPFKQSGWLQAGGYLFYEGSAVTIKFSPVLT